MVFKYFACFFLLLFHNLSYAQHQSKAISNYSIEINYSEKHPVNRFIPSVSLGAAFDGHAYGDIQRILQPANIKAMKSVGLRPLSYRLRTELAGEVWHWNPKGKWSDPTKDQGYWVSDDHSDSLIKISYGFRLPRRGNTHDQANDDGYSRLDDGDSTTFWKSNPYLDVFYTKEDNNLHPQWVIVDLGKSFNLNALKIKWSDPYAVFYNVEYAFDIGNDYFEPYNPGLWHAFSSGKILNPNGSYRLVKLTQKPVYARFLKISMTAGSQTSLTSSKDIRDRLGFAIYELEAGLIDQNNIFHDYVHHGKTNKTQSVIHVSSTDPWHTSKDIDLNTEQAGIDQFFLSGLADSDVKVMMPIALLYDSHENMLAYLNYINSKHYPVLELEMGEEPEGQLVNPHDYATLYFQLATQITAAFSQFKLGGPGFAAVSFTEDDPLTFTERQWTTQFLDYLKNHNGLKYFNFFSTEWYPFDDICSPTPPQLLIAPEMLRIGLKDFTQKILPTGIPVYITEYGYSAYGGRPEVDIEGALMYADILGEFLNLGGNKCYLYGYEPSYLDQTKNCDWGNNMLFGMNDSGAIIYKTAAYYGMYMVMHYWAFPSDSELSIYKAIVFSSTKKRSDIISSYALLRPGNKWSVMLINKDPVNTYNVTIHINNRSKEFSGLHYPLQLFQYSHKQYQWKSDEGEGHPVLELPPEEKIIKRKSIISLPPYSITVLKE